jgi:hypothetical protein
MRRHGPSTAPDPAVMTQDLAYGDDEKQYARIYKPAAAAGGALLPMIVYYHGSGWMAADINVRDPAPAHVVQAVGRDRGPGRLPPRRGTSTTRTEPPATLTHLAYPTNGVAR